MISLYIIVVNTISGHSISITLSLDLQGQVRCDILPSLYGDNTQHTCKNPFLCSINVAPVNGEVYVEDLINIRNPNRLWLFVPVRCAEDGLPGAQLRDGRDRGFSQADPVALRLHRTSAAQPAAAAHAPAASAGG